MEIVKVKFEVFGIVQGVFFRNYTREEANRIGLVGWVQNTPKGTVIGEVEGTRDLVERMKHWLRYTGSPQSTISDAKFEERVIERTSFNGFNVIR